MELPINPRERSCYQDGIYAQIVDFWISHSLVASIHFYDVKVMHSEAVDRIRIRMSCLENEQLFDGLHLKGMKPLWIYSSPLSQCNQY